jgi:voltage-gated potassium channel
MSLTEPAGRDGSSRSWTNEALVSLPARSSSPAVQLLRRGLLALLLLSLVVLLVWIDRDSYRDSYDGTVDLIDAIYYATVTITTTGYGDITPVAPHARVLSAIIVTPLRVAFLVLLVGTTLEVLAHHGRRMFKDARWRKRMRNHVVVVGFGTKGKSAVETLQNNGANPSQVVVIDSHYRCECTRIRRHRRRRHPAGDLAPSRNHEGPPSAHHRRSR